MATLESNVGVVQENLESCTREPLAKKTQEKPGRAGLFFTPGVSHLNQVLIVRFGTRNFAPTVLLARTLKA